MEIDNNRCNALSNAQVFRNTQPNDLFCEKYIFVSFIYSQSMRPVCWVFILEFTSHVNDSVQYSLLRDFFLFDDLANRLRI